MDRVPVIDGSIGRNGSDATEAGGLAPLLCALGAALFAAEKARQHAAVAARQSA